MAGYVDQIVLSYHDSLLRQSDLSLLQLGQWLNDNVLGFVFEYFEKEKFFNFANKATFVSPQVTQFIKFAGDDELGVFLSPLELKTKELVFSFINDNQTRSAGGTHWSFMLFHRRLHKFQHYDSLHNMNASVARKISEKLLPYLGVNERTTFVNEKCPQQQNYYDCGLFAVSVAEYLCQVHLLNEKQSLKSIVTQDSVTKKRDEIRSLIITLSENSSKECSSDFIPKSESV
ncbi:sentrin-specific protease 8-like [Anneissia japonica]|uniref:sentrin-specific protease 8-like n=1 Tax=Anneissia japonica TaxID=1529436 RepID=UPI001425648E|nr:sentrin-specific protease 8-like [Anneissia japonica]